MTWITEDGQRRVDVISTVDRGQWFTVSRWATAARRWIVVPDEAELRSVAELAKHVDISKLREVEKQ